MVSSRESDLEASQTSELECNRGPWNAVGTGRMG